MKLKVLIFLVVFISSSGFSQQQFVGVGLQSEFKSYNKLSLAYGLSYENQLSKHHGFEVDLNYRSSMLYFNLNAPASGINNLDVAVRENFISLPVFYRFYSTIVNLSTGFTFDYFVSGNYLPNAQNQVFSDYYIDPKLYIG